MARPIKRGLSYFPLDTDFLRDRKVQRLILKYGSDGISAFIGVLCEIYATDGYFLRVTDEVYFDIGFTLQMEENRVKEIIRYCLKIRLFDDNMFRIRRIITSRGIQERFRLICKRSINQIDKAYSLVDDANVNVTETPQNVTEIPQNSQDNPFSVTKTPLKGKGKGKGNKKKKENKKEKNDEQKKSESYEKDQSADADATIRREQLLRMAADAAAGSPDA